MHTKKLLLILGLLLFLNIYLVINLFFSSRKDLTNKLEKDKIESNCSDLILDKKHLNCFQINKNSEGHQILRLTTHVKKITNNNNEVNFYTSFTYNSKSFSKFKIGLLGRNSLVSLCQMEGVNLNTANYICVASKPKDVAKKMRLNTPIILEFSTENSEDDTPNEKCEPVTKKFIDGLTNSDVKSLERIFNSSCTPTVIQIYY